MIHELDDIIRSKYPDVAPRGRSGLPAIVKTTGFANGGQSTGLVFPGRSVNRPSLVVKISHAASEDPRIEVEYRNLIELRAQSEFLRDSTPEPIGLEQVHGRPALILRADTRAVRLKDLHPRRYLAPRRAAATLLRAAQWSIRFTQETSGSRSVLDRETIQREIEQPIASYLSRLRPKGRERDFLAALSERASSFAGLELPLAPSHGDFCPANILQRGDRWLVIDWENPLSPGLPLGDLFYFIASLDYAEASATLRGNRGRNFSIAYFKDGGAYRDLVRRCFEQAIAELAIPREIMDTLFFAHWVRAALDKLDYLERIGLDPFASITSDFDDVMPIARYRTGTCANVREGLERAA